MQVTADDDLPRNICTFCAHQAKSVHYFILKCQESDRKLRHSLNEFRKFDKIEETLDKIDYDDQNDANDTDDQDLNDPKESEPIKSSSNLVSLFYRICTRIRFLCTNETLYSVFDTYVLSF